GRPLRGGVDRNVIPPSPPFPPTRRPLRGGVDRNVVGYFGDWRRAGRPLRGGVDRNNIRAACQVFQPSRPLRGGVDRNFMSAINPPPMGVAPCAGAWIETSALGVEKGHCARRPLHWRGLCGYPSPGRL